MGPTLVSVLEPLLALKRWDRLRQTFLIGCVILERGGGGEGWWRNNGSKEEEGVQKGGRGGVSKAMGGGGVISLRVSCFSPDMDRTQGNSTKVGVTDVTFDQSKVTGSLPCLGNSTEGEDRDAKNLYAIEAIEDKIANEREKGEDREAKNLYAIEVIEDKIANVRVTDAAESCDGRV
jgi:hypothetical protein